MNSFFDVLISRIENEKLRAIQYLLCRGFLLENKDGEWYVSDNSHKNDPFEMNQILKKNQVGEIDASGRIVLWNNANVDTLKNMFTCEYQKGFESEGNVRSWQWFRRREHGYKIPTMDLEPFIAMYVKAISACGIETWFSCDGNNHRDLAIEIGMNGMPNRFWHKMIWEKILNVRFDLPWEKDYEYIRLDENKFKYYAKLNKAALFLYESRQQFRYMKKEVMSILTPSREYAMTNDNIETLIESRMDDYLIKHKF